MRWASIFVCAIVVALISGSSSGDDVDTSSGSPAFGETAFRSQKARAAQAAFSTAVSDAESAYASKYATALKAYENDLGASLTAATKAGKLDDANQVNAELTLVKKAVADLAKPGKMKPKTKGLNITSAKFGLNDQWVDLTKEIRSIVKDGRISNLQNAVNKSKAPEPSPGQHKYIILEGTYEGSDFSFRVIDVAFSTFEFGRPPIK